MKTTILAVIALGITLALTAHAQVPGIINYQGRIVDGGTNFNGTGLFKFALVDGGTNTASQATATAVTNSHFVTGITITFGGSGYASAPTVTITGGGGSSAAATSTISGGVVVNITVTNAGSGYTSVPTVTIAPPPPNILYATFWSNGVNTVSLPVTKGLYSVLLGDTTITNMSSSIPATAFTNATVQLRVWFNDGVNGLQQLSPDQRLGAAGYALVANSISPSSTGTVYGQSLDIGSGNSLAGSFSSIAGGVNNTDQSSDSAIGGGSNNTIQVFSQYSTVGGGNNNSVLSNSPESTIAGGINNIASGPYSTVCGGQGNSASGTGSFVGGGSGDAFGGNTASGGNSTVCGGLNNTASGTGSFVGGGGTVGGAVAANIASGPASTVCGGLGNTASGTGSFVGGGNGNNIQGSDQNSFLGGGFNNSIGPNANCATIPGGQYNAVGNGVQFAFAAGYRAKANHTGTFVWADNQNADFGSISSNQVSFRCQGGVLFTSGSGAANNTVSWTPGSGAWSFTSDRNAKENFETLDVQAILAKVAQLPLTEWSYKGYTDRHVGPMAQDFHAAFPFNANDRMLNSADLAGVSLAAIQGLNQKLEEQVKEKDGQIAELHRELGELKSQIQKVSEQVGQSKAALQPAANAHVAGGI